MFTSGAAQAILAVSGIGAARILGVDDRGKLALFNLLPTLLVLLGTFGLPVAITYFVARDPANSGAIARTALRSCTALTLGLTGADLIILALIFHGQPAYVVASAGLSLFLVPSNVAQLVGQALLQGEQRFAAFNWCRIMPAVMYALGILVLAALSLGTLFTLTLDFVVTQTLVGGATLFVAVKDLPRQSGQGQSPGIRAMFRFGGKAVLGAVYPTETFQLDQATVGLFLSSASLGLYVVAVAFTNLPRFIAQSLGVIAYPRVAALRDRTRQRRMIVRFTAAAVVIAGSVCMVLELSVGFLIPVLFGHDFSAAVPITRILLVSSFVVSVRRVLADGLRGAGYPTLGTIGEGVAMLVLLPALVLLIPRFGLSGAAIAVCVSSITGLTVLLAVTWRVSRRSRGRQSSLVAVGADDAG
jgi:O-antigen/teichoic acid export membrane protein